MAYSASSHQSPSANGDSSEMLALVRVFDDMRNQMAKVEKHLNGERLANEEARKKLEDDRRKFEEEVAEQRRVLAEERQQLEKDRASLAASAKAASNVKQPPVPMPKRVAPVQGSSDAVQNVKAAPVARTKDAPQSRGSAGPEPAAPVPKPKPKAKALGTPQGPPSPVQSPTVASTPPRTVDSPSTRNDDLDVLADVPPSKPEEADEADRLALEDGAESTPQPSKAPPDPPTYWRHVKPPPKGTSVFTKAGPEAEPHTPKKETVAPVKSNPAWAATRCKAPPGSPGKDEAQSATNVVSESPKPVPSKFKAPPTRCPPSSPAKASAPPSDDTAASPASGSPPPTAAKGKFKAPPVGAKAKVKAVPGQ